MLDEPTNHLDVDSRSALIDAINAYPGAVILVSHDRYLLAACADRLLLVSDGGVATFDGDLDEYRKLVLGERTASGENNGPPIEACGRRAHRGSPCGGRKTHRARAAAAPHRRG